MGKIIQYLIARKDDNRDIKIQTAEFLGLTSQNWMAIYQAQNWKIVKFADKLKDIVCLLIGYTRSQLEAREFKEKELGEEWWYYKGRNNSLIAYSKDSKRNREDLIKLTPRLLLQLVGTDLFRNQLHPNTWVTATFANYQNNNWIITDMRFPNELEAIKKRNGITIRINRGPIERTGKMIQEPEHISENSLDNAKFDYVIENSGTIEDLIEQVKKILIKEKII